MEGDGKTWAFVDPLDSFYAPYDVLQFDEQVQFQLCTIFWYLNYVLQPDMFL